MDRPTDTVAQPTTQPTTSHPLAAVFVAVLIALTGLFATSGTANANHDAQPVPNVHVYYNVMSGYYVASAWNGESYVECSNCARVVPVYKTTAPVKGKKRLVKRQLVGYEVHLAGTESVVRAAYGYRNSLTGDFAGNDNWDAFSVLPLTKRIVGEFDIVTGSLEYVSVDLFDKNRPQVVYSGKGGDGCITGCYK